MDPKLINYLSTTDIDSAEKEIIKTFPNARERTSKRNKANASQTIESTQSNQLNEPSQSSLNLTAQYRNGNSENELDFFQKFANKYNFQNENDNVKGAPK